MRHYVSSFPCIGRRHTVLRRVRDTLQGVRLTTFWHQMEGQFGPAYARSVAKDYVLAGLNGRTVDQALADGEDAAVVWRAVCEAFELPERLRLPWLPAPGYRRQRREVFTLSATISRITRPCGPTGDW
jgi:hypothetical protein